MDSERDRPDPVLVNSGREAIVVLVAWAVFLIWSVGVSLLSGYDLPEGPVPTTLGMPRWVLLGVLLPWLVATVFTIVYSLRYMKDDDLGGDAD